MKTIWKFEFHPHKSISMPKGAEILSVQEQHGKTCIWAMVNPNAPLEIRKIVIYGTGHVLPNDPGQFIGTFQLQSGAYVFHMFEEGK